jgi:hypothetical protein
VSWSRSDNQESPIVAPRSSRALSIGAALVVVAGLGMLVGTFLPWATAEVRLVDGRNTQPDRGVGSFSGWDLIVDCAHREVPSTCVIEEPSTVISSEREPTRVTSGVWSLVLGGGTTAVGIALFGAARRRGACPRCLILVGWLVAFGGLAGAIAMFLTLFDEPNGSIAMFTERGVVMTAASATLGIVAMAVVQIGASGRAEVPRDGLVSASLV